LSIVSKLTASTPTLTINPRIILFVLLFSYTNVQAKTYFFQEIDGNLTHKNSPLNSSPAAETPKKLTTLDALSKIKWEVGLVAAEAIREGLSDWNWGSRSSFQTTREGWLGARTKSGGADKLGHMYSSYLMTELFTKRLNRKTNNKTAAAKKAALFSTSIMFWLEVADGYSRYGFSPEDVVFNSLGIGLSYLRNTVPGLDKKFDLRMQYDPTHNSDRPVIDYSGHTNIFAVKLGGFQKLQSTPLKYLELQLGYHTQGYDKDDKKHYSEKTTEVLFGVGINLTEAVFKPMKKHTDNSIVDYADTFFQYYQAPGINFSTPIRETKIPFK